MPKPLASMKVGIVSTFLDAFLPEDSIVIKKIRGMDTLVVSTASGEEHSLRFERTKKSPDEE